MITKEMLRTDLPPIIDYPDGSCNSVLVCERRRYVNPIGSRWSVSNTHYYCQNVERFEGWMDLEHLSSHSLPENVLEVVNEVAMEAHKLE